MDTMPSEQLARQQVVSSADSYAHDLRQRAAVSWKLSDVRVPRYLENAACIASGMSREMGNRAAAERASAASVEVGKEKWKLAHRPSLGVAHKRPPCDSMIERLIASPMPLRCGLVVTKTSKIRSALPAGSPTPVSLTEITAWPSCGSDFTNQPLASPARNDLLHIKCQEQLSWREAGLWPLTA